jgi:hypothetical protein
VSYTPILAHFGHWYISLPTFMAPAVIIAAALKISAWRERRRAAAGDTSHVRVAVIPRGDRETLAVTGPLDYPAVLDIEHELGGAVGRAPRVLLDLSGVTAVTEELAWRIPEIVGELGGDGGKIEVFLGSAPAAHSLRRICALEGVRLIDDPGPAGEP